MVFTGELEQLHIVDIIQLLNTTRKSGTFSVRGQKGESRIIFSNGYIVGANHLSNRVRIGSVLVKMKAITVEDLEQALDKQKKAGRGRKPLINTLIELGKLRREDAARGLKKLIEITLVELIGWKSGTFTLDSDAVSVSPECSYPLSAMEQEISLDAQMLLMDALRIYDERERDRQTGKSVPADEELFADVVPLKTPSEKERGRPVITADDLGLGDLDHLERKMPQFVPEDEVFDPVEIHRQKIKETLSGFPEKDQELFVSFLEKSAAGRIGSEGTPGKEDRTKGIVLFSDDEFITHSVMTICKADGILVFATDGEEELLRIMDQCIKIGVLPVMVFDDPGASERLLSREKIVSLRRQVQSRYPLVPFIQAALIPDYDFLLQSYRDGAKAVFPKPCLESGKTTKFVGDAISFLEVLKSYMNRFSPEQKILPEDQRLRRLKENVLALRSSHSADPSLALLQCVSGMCERAITFVVRRSELAGERAIGVFAEKSEGPTSVTRLKIPLTAHSVFREALEKGTVFCGEKEDDVLREYLFDAIGEPLEPAMILVPVNSGGEVVMLVYGDFGAKEAARVPEDLLEILANQTGMALENASYKQIKGSRK